MVLALGLACWRAAPPPVYAGWSQIGRAVECYNADYMVMDDEVTLCGWDCAQMGDGLGHRVTAIWRYDGCAWTLDDLEVGDCHMSGFIRAPML